MITDNVFSNFSSSLGLDMEGWLSPGSPFAKLFDSVNAKTAVEVGVWKGLSAITLGKHMLSLDGVTRKLYCVDTFLGSTGQGSAATQENGMTSIQEQFMQNVVLAGLTDILVPVPMSSVDAAAEFKKLGFIFDYIYIDANHDYEFVNDDIAAWWPLLRSGGVMLGHDYVAPQFRGVIRAVDEHSKRVGKDIQVEDTVWYMYKG